MKVFLSYALSLAGLGFIAAAVAGAMLVNLSYVGARFNMINMLRQSANKAELMCKTAKLTFYQPLGEAMKIAAMAQTTDLKILAMSTLPTYDANCQMVTMHWKKLFGRGKKGAALVIGGLAAAIAVKTSPVLHIIVVVIAAVAAIWFMVTKSENERSLVRARAEILPEVDRAFAEGRYVRYG
ncbi:MAG: hypothetical protein HOV81_01635 [Kofleriaceae bacterium]|nr:hypothetical protein [Kofleriaceae bacterium]